MLSSSKPVRACDAKKQKLLKDILEKMDQAEVIARGLGIENHEITRLREEGLRELNLRIST
ncbi:hypothetical protein DSLASN_00020 [Desulfoluna limicola]|uniref:Uncharacterized protein n=1 Tax=Desulfoluna limicola TaxID=2810562 RepID=A0ABN6EZ82_9BACT|nr:hypothetical protein [Desulfoluna limicola]BCS94370.1 hypothetical protein DSLASN_00020 [Desulfoluna limicola]